jgi:hypothetical protein
MRSSVLSRPERRLATTRRFAGSELAILTVMMSAQTAIGTRQAASRLMASLPVPRGKIVGGE